MKRAEGPGSARWRLAVARGAALLVVLGLWQCLGDDSEQIHFPTALGTLRSLYRQLADGSLVVALAKSNESLLLGYSLAVLVALPAGVVAGLSARTRRAIDPFLTIMIATPLIAVEPVVQAIFGLSLSARVAVVFLFAVGILARNTMVGVMQVDPSLWEMGRSFRAPRLAMLRKIVFPSALPAIMAGARLALGQAVSGMVVAELTLVGFGIGSAIEHADTTFRTADLIAIVLVVMAEGVLLSWGARLLQRKFEQWRIGEPDFA
jgi:ABC-type nitrate/sulfonate/bicarbonate transport system permease component